MKKYTRRDFIKTASLAGLAMSAGGLSLLGKVFAAPLPHIGIAKGDSPSALVQKAVELIGGMKRFVSRGDVVVIKPNIGWDRTPEQAGNTNPLIVGTLVKMAFDAGAKVVKVLDNTCNDARRCYINSGIQAQAKKYGATVLHVEDFRLRDMNLAGDIIKNWKVYKDFVECDSLINVPILKHHGLAGVTVGMKNWLGAIGGRRWTLHQNINTTVVDLAAFFKPKLTVLDAYRVLLRNGPQGGSLGDVDLKKTVAAGVDPVAIDSLGVKLFGAKQSDYGFIEVASKRNLGQKDLSKVTVKETSVA